MVQRPPSILVTGLETGQRTRLQESAAKIVAQALRANEVIDQQETDLRREAARQAVADQFATFFPGQQISAEGENLMPLQIDATQ
jgi:hypothetical protein